MANNGSSATPLKHHVSYYGEDRYDTGANQVLLKSRNPFDDESADYLNYGYRPSFCEDEPTIKSGESKLKRLSSLSKMIPTSMPRILSPRNSFARMDDEIDEKSSDGSNDIFETGLGEPRKLKKKLSFLGRLKV
jgi:hypothetical protein